MSKHRWMREARPFQLHEATSAADGRAVFVFSPAFTSAPHVTPVLKFTAAAGCTAHLVGNPTTTGCTVEVRKPKALALGLVGVAHEPAPGVTVQILAQLLD